MTRRYYLKKEVRRILGLTPEQLRTRIKNLGIKPNSRRISLKDFERIRDYKPMRNAPKGEQHWKAKLNRKKVLDIIDTAGEIDAEVVADYYKVHKTTVESIRKGKTWKHLQPKNRL